MWAQVGSFILGIWLMASPGVLGYAGIAADNDHIVGPVIATFAMISWWECTRPVRLWNIPLGAWLLLSPWVLAYSGDTQLLVNDSLVGMGVLLLSPVKGKVGGAFGGGWRSLWQRDALHEQEARKRKGSSWPG